LKVVRAKVDSVEEARNIVKEAQLYAYTWKTKLLTLLKKLLRRH